MQAAEFSKAYDETLMAIEEAIDDLDGDFDYENMNGILTITCPDGSQVIVTPQSATAQLWVAARSGGFHFTLQAGRWLRTRDGADLVAVLDEVFVDQAGVVLGLA